jgi:hypothetical protein
MTESEWLTCTDPMPMLEFLRGKASARKLRLFAAARCREVWQLFAEEKSRYAVEMAERWADSRNDSELASAHEAARVAYQEALDKWPHHLPVHATEPDVANAALLIARHRGPTLYHRVSVANQLREVFGNPIRPSPHLPPAFRTWNDGTICRLAESIYKDRDFTYVNILADALEELGCNDADILNHLRGPGPHVRGCWVVDLLLGKDVVRSVHGS